jgi:hypothetical protein
MNQNGEYHSNGKRVNDNENNFLPSINSPSSRDFFLQTSASSNLECKFCYNHHNTKQRINNALIPDMRHAVV